MRWADTAVLAMGFVLVSGILSGVFATITTAIAPDNAVQ